MAGHPATQRHNAVAPEAPFHCHYFKFLYFALGAIVTILEKEYVLLEALRTPFPQAKSDQTTSTMNPDTNTVSKSTILRRGLAIRCPNCGHHPIFETRFRLMENCPLCMMRLQRGTGWFLGPMVINYGITVFGLVLPLLILGFSGLIALTAALTGIGIAVVALPVLLYRWCWGLWLALYYFTLPHELPNNNKTFEMIDP